MRTVIFVTFLLQASSSELSKKEDIPLEKEIPSPKKSAQGDTENGFHPSKPLYSEHWMYPGSKLSSQKTQASKLHYNSRDGELHAPHIYAPKDKTYYNPSAQSDYEPSESYTPSATSYVRPDESPNYDAKINFPLTPKDYQAIEDFMARPVYNKGYSYGVPWNGDNYGSTYSGYSAPYSGFGQSNNYPGFMTGKFISSLKNGFGKQGLNLLFGLLPAALLIAALVPNFVVVPVQGVSAGNTRGIGRILSNLSGRKRRDVSSNPVLELINEYGVASLDDPNCMKKIVCQVTRQGRKNGNFVQKIFYHLANSIPEKTASYFGLKYLVRAIKRNKCEAFFCPRGKHVTMKGTR